MIVGLEDSVVSRVGIEECKCESDVNCWGEAECYDGEYWGEYDGRKNDLGGINRRFVISVGSSLKEIEGEWKIDGSIKERICWERVVMGRRRRERRENEKR